MGDRALIIFKNCYSVSSTVYLHWGGIDAEGYIETLRRLAGDEELTPGYAAARLIGIAHQDTPGVMSIGVYNTSDELADSILKGDGDQIAEQSNGDAGIVIVSTKDYSWQAYGGYLAQNDDEEAA